MICFNFRKLVITSNIPLPNILNHQQGERLAFSVEKLDLVEELEVQLDHCTKKFD